MAPTVRARLAGHCFCVLFACLAFAAGPALAATITVNSTADVAADDGQCTLREAITAANTNAASGAMAGECTAGAAGLDTIAFNIAGAGVHTIQPTNVWPTIIEPLTIDGYTQPGASANTLPVGNNAVLLIEIDASANGNNKVLVIDAGASGSTIRGLVLSHLPATSTAIEIGPFGVPTNNNTISGNFIGTDPGGSVASAGGGQVIVVAGDANVVGGSTPAARNVIVGGGERVRIGGTGNVVRGNYIGLNAAGTAALLLPGGASAVQVFSATGTLVGGTAAGEGNVIVSTTIGVQVQASIGTVIQGNLFNTNAAGTAMLSSSVQGIHVSNNTGQTMLGGPIGAGNVIAGASNGIEVFGSALDTAILGNFIGTDVSGTLALSNGVGILINTPFTSAGNRIGGTLETDGNVIAFNSNHGVRIATGGAQWPILGNAIFSNGGLGISLGAGPGPLPNDPGDVDNGPANQGQNYPVITSAVVTAGNATVSGTLNSAPDTTFRIEFFASAACDASGNGEGQTFSEFTSVTTNGAGNASFGPLSFPVNAGESVITATATDPGNNTSEFSACAAAPSADVSVTETDTPDPVVAGSNITYTITVMNAGPSPATSASLSDTLPAGTTFVSATAPAGWTLTTPPLGGTGTVTATNASLASGANATFTIVVQAGAGVPAGTVITNTATVTSGVTDPNPGNNSVSTTTTVAAAATADLSVTKTDSPDPVAAGANITYTIIVANAGPAAAANVALSDTLPAATTFVSASAPAGWTLTTPPVGGTGTVTATNASLASGASATITLVVNVNGATSAGTLVNNTATVSSTTGDSNPGNNAATAGTTVAALPTLSIDSVSANEGNAGTIAFTFTVTLSAASASTVTVNFATADGSASAGSDYVATSGMLTFSPGATTQTITVNVTGDTTPESNETFVVNLSAPANATIATGQGTGTIVDDDAAPTPPTVIPTLSEWALAALALLLLASAMARLRRRAR